MGAYEEEDPGVLRKYRLIIIGGVIVAIGLAVWFIQRRFERSSHSRQDRDVVMVNLPPAPPPPPAPVPAQTPPPTETESKMIAQDPVNEMETKPDETAKN